MACKLSPSILSADFGILKEQIGIINESNADLIHVDVMDGVFVPNISFGFTILDSLVKYVRKPLDIHLMIADADKYLERFAGYKPEYLTVHLEACPHLNRTVQAIRSLGIKVGIALNPHTPVSMLDEIIPETDLVLVMSVNPGYGGQKFIASSLQKIRKTKALITEKNAFASIEVDGGVNSNNIKQLIEAGADIIVAGNAVFGAADIKEAINELKSCCL
ncbi:MAG TPA: ribulose-phosphate 3-epimerase [Bacteroidales bacterium]|jgi:ribulose-phosphate 3-epimerase|nr:ribulose-phosphate 3-epimerase [Bacteroidales bacterium]HNZ41953.1 ribulose-phosphate 3-epimerase [Bacteroidales bacterium]HPB24246.1 ribulose-phosphate 3-epimerase [Bacteroidales bacterium]HPI28931.1 ribulose-phosphate 3-epimerase [Bacteroidales bacterium]HQN14841.1 ribulose-phosphate 3-epimerase [Bacteroidales bacterium]